MLLNKTKASCVDQIIVVMIQQFLISSRKLFVLKKFSLKIFIGNKEIELKE